MDALQQSLSSYKEQLLHIELAISSAETETDKESLFSLKSDIQQLIDLTRDSLSEIIPSSSSSNNEHDPFAKEYALFISEIQQDEITDDKKNCNDELKSLEGTKCRAPHKHQWGDTVYHNAMICSVLASDKKNFDEIEVKVMFTNPTHKEMLPCPYYLETDCKFSVEQCRYSHGEIVQFSSLKDYIEPNFELISIGSKVLAKKSDKLWHRATVKRILKEKCLVKFDSVAKDIELDLQDVFLLDDDCGNDDDYSSVDSDDDESKEEDIINTSLMISPSNQALGYWEKYTKGIGSKLMTKMGYVIGTGLGKKSEGRIEPVTAVILPAGKSLDHCMKLRENAGGDEDLFSVERKLRRLQKKQEIQNQKAYEREKNKTDVFNFLNDTLAVNKANDLTLSKSEHRQEIMKETSRSLNVASLKIDEDIKRVERDLYKIKESLLRHKDVNSQIHKSLKVQLHVKQNELDTLNSRSINIHNEQSNRSDKKKLTVF